MQEAAQHFGLALAVNLQRRAFGGPDRAVLRRRLFRPGIEDDAVQDQPPDGTWNLDHPRIGQKLFDIVKYINDTLKLKQKYYELSVKSIRFKKNYDIFKRELQLKHYKFKNRNEEFWIGNRNSNLHLSLITNPYCGYCKDAYLILIKILKNYPDVSIQLRFNYFSDNTDDNLTSIISIFKNIFINHGHELLFEAIEFWHDNNDIEILKKNYSSFAFETELDDVIKLAEENKIFALTQTPQILINNYLFPNLYEREDILYFIDDLIEDKEILNNYA